MKKIIPLFLVSLFLLSACTNNTVTPTNSTPKENTNAITVEPSKDITETTTEYTMAQLAEHNSPESCWLLIDGKIYDVTGFSDKHAGGEAVLLGCGIDATELFESRPNTGEPHSEKARSFLPNFYIGDLAK